MMARADDGAEQLSAGSRPVEWWHLILAILGTLLTIAGTAWSILDRVSQSSLANERRITIIEERQLGVLKAISDLRYEHTKLVEKQDAIDRATWETRLELTVHENKDVSRLLQRQQQRPGGPRVSEPWDK